MRAIFADRFGSYWMLATFPWISSLSRLKSTILYLLLCPPPMWRVVILPVLPLPPVFLTRVTSDFSGFVSVISSYVSPLINRLPAEVGLNSFTPIMHLQRKKFCPWDLF